MLNRFAWQLKCLFFAALAFSPSCLRSGDDGGASVTVETPSGVYEGRQKNTSVSFKGIPYAAPVDGDRRWLPPAPVAGLAGSFPAQKFGSPCSHLDELFPDKRKPEHFKGAGDCLNLNIWVPPENFTERQQKKIPVMVFFHGGAFEIGSASWNPYGLRMYNGANLAAAGPVAVVTINYRLGALGFFRHEALNAGTGAGANPGLLDQIAALRWVQKNISTFGGDPGNVTVFGESAGAMSICDLLTVPEAKGLLHKAIMQSGSCIAQSPEFADETAKKVLTRLNCFDQKTPKEQADCMRSRSDEEIVVASPMTTLSGGKFTRLQFAPVIDGITLSENPDAVIKSRRHIQVPVLIGTNAREVPAFMQPESKDSWEGIVGEIAAGGPEGTAKAIRELYEGRNRGTYKDLIAEIKTDVSFTCRARHYAALLAAHQTAPVWLYFFDKSFELVGNWVDGSFHGMELPYLFQHLPRWLDGRSSHFELQKALGKLWTTFAATGVAGGEDPWQDWKPYSQQSRVAGVMGDFYGVLDDPRKEKCEQLEKVMLKNGEMELL